MRGAPMQSYRHRKPGRKSVTKGGRRAVRSVSDSRHNGPAGKRRSSKRTATRRIGEIAPKGRSHSSYVEILLDSVGSKGDTDSKKISLSLNSIMISSSPQSREASYLMGIPIGHLIYKRVSHRPHETLYESLQVLTEFFDTTGQITAHYTLPHQIIFFMYGDDTYNIGIKSHSLEAGIISGFVSSAMHRHINISEESCRFSGSDKCVFVSHAKEDTDNAKIQRAGISHLIGAGMAGEEDSSGASYAYEGILLSLIDNPRISHDAYNSARMVGSVVRERADSIKNAANKMNYILDGIRLFGIGRPRADKDYIYLELRRDVSRMGVVRLAAALFSGILDRDTVSVETRMVRGRYIIRVKRRV